MMILLKVHFYFCNQNYGVKEESKPDYEVKMLAAIFSARMFRPTIVCLKYKIELFLQIY